MHYYQFLINIVFYYDDAIFHKYDDWGNWFVKKLLGNKLDTVLIHSDHVICGNAYIQKWADRINLRTTIIPTVVDCNKYHQDFSYSSDHLTIGWIGSPATWCYMEPYLDFLSALSIKYQFDVLIIGSGISDPLPGRFRFIEKGHSGKCWLWSRKCPFCRAPAAYPNYPRYFG